MDDSTDELTKAALQLSPADRARLAEALLVSLEAEGAAWESAWLAEAVRRSQALDADPSRGAPAAEVFATVRERFQGGTDSAR